MYFNVLGSEYFLRRNLGSCYVLISLVLLIIHMATREMTFENAHFYVRGFSHFYWGALWMLLFLYWNGIHFFIRKKIPAQLRSLNSKLPFYALNISFLMSATYCYFFGLYRNIVGENRIGNFCGGIASNFEIVFDAPSIWCVFASIQGIFIFLYAKQLQKVEGEFVNFKYEGEIPFRKILIVSLIIWGVIFLTLPMFSGLSYKMILK